MRTSCLFLFFLLIGVACSTQNTDPAPLTTNPVSNTQWHGLFTYKGETVQRVFTIHFKSTGNFVWQDMSGSYDGTWNLTEASDKVIITFNVNGIQTSFTLLGGNELSSPKNLNHTTWTVAQLRKIESPAVQPINQTLPKTKWSGQLYSYSLAFDETSAGKVIWRGGSTGATLMGSPGYTVTGQVIVSEEVNMGLSNRGRFFGVFINDKTLRANFWFYRVGEAPFEIANADDFIKK